MSQARLDIFVAVALLALPVIILDASATTEESLYPGSLPAANVPYVGEWVIHPGDPGPNLPPVGRSLFDLLFTTDGTNGLVYDIPFPFARVIDRIKDQLPPDDQSGFSSLKTVLIPIGRSLQRNAAAPDFFRYPRIVVAVDTESRSPLFLKDRLFLGYQEKSNRIEVISYNDAAGRFEFQIVKDYAPGRRPKVRYAERAICTSCHQNGAPIFARARWSETNFNRAIINHLLQYNTHYHGVPVENAGNAGFIDQATDRANLFSAYQLLWREGCADGVALTQAYRCRAAALVAMLQLRLSASSRFNRQAVLYRDYFVPVLTRQWQRRWPEGLLIPSADIPNHNPSVEAVSADVPTRFDPLAAQPPRSNWSVKSHLNRIITGLSEFMSSHDIARLDDYLFERGLHDGTQHEDFNGTCKFSQQDERTSETLVNFECQLVGTGSDQVFDLVGDVVFDRNWQVSPTINWLTLGNNDGFASLALSGGPIQAGQDYWSVELDLFHRKNGLHGRLPNGDAMVALRLRWPNTNTDHLPFPLRGEFSGSATLTVMQDFSKVHEVIAGILAQSNRGQHDMFSSEAFQGTKAMAAVFTELGIDANEYCCDLSNMPRAEVDSMDDVSLVNLQATLEHNDALKTFYRFCGTCHQAATTVPPGFLFGDDKKQINVNLTQCAPRILYRLRMWQLNDEQPKSPMPPPKRLRAFNYSVDDWRQSPELSSMKQYIGGLLASKSGQILAQDLLNTLYADLPPCLP